MNVPIPTPTPEQVAASVALENSRRQYRLQDRVTLLVMHKPDAVLAARDGEPTLVDPKPTLAPHITKKSIDDFNSAINPGAPSVSNPASPVPNAAPDAAPTAATAAAPAAAPPAAPLQLQDVPAANAPTGASSAVTSVQGAAPTAAPSGGNSMGVEILTPGATVKPADNGGLKAVGPENATPLPEAEKPAGAPDAVNDIAGKPQPAAQTPNANGKKNPKPEFDKDDESSSKHKKKKGLGKLNPF